MVKLDVSCMRTMSKEDFRVLTAVEMGMKNHDLVPVELIRSIAKLKTGGVNRIITTLHAFKLIAHDRSTYDGYRLTFQGYDILALRVLLARGHITAVGNKVGVGKESDIYIAQNQEGEEVVLKLHRLGRTSFRAVKSKRDYLRSRSHASWLYMSRLSALKEFAFMKALHENGFPTPVPIDHSRHVVLMSLIDGFPMYQLRSGSLKDPESVFRQCMGLITRMAEHGLIHCDFNEFNLLLNRPPVKDEIESSGKASEPGDDDDKEVVTLIDFPQMISTRHRNAEEMFDRDVNCIIKFFTMKMRWDPPPELIPSFHDMIRGQGSAGYLDDAVKASGFGEEEEEDYNSYLQEEDMGLSEGEEESEAGGEQEADEEAEDEGEDEVDAGCRIMEPVCLTDGVGEADELGGEEEFGGSDVDLTGSGSDEPCEEEGAAETNNVSSSRRQHRGAAAGDPSIQNKALKAAQTRHRGTAGSGKSRNFQKKRVKGKTMRKGQDF